MAKTTHANAGTSAALAHALQSGGSSPAHSHAISNLLPGCAMKQMDERKDSDAWLNVKAGNLSLFFTFSLCNLIVIDVLGIR